MNCSELLNSYIFAAFNGVLLGLLSNFLWISISKNIAKPRQMMGLCIASTIKIAIIGMVAATLLRCGTINFILFVGCFFVTSAIGAWRAI